MELRYPSITSSQSRTVRGYYGKGYSGPSRARDIHFIHTYFEYRTRPTQAESSSLGDRGALYRLSCLTVKALVNSLKRLHLYSFPPLRHSASGSCL